MTRLGEQLRIIHLKKGSAP